MREVPFAEIYDKWINRSKRVALERIFSELWTLPRALHFDDRAARLAVQGFLAHKKTLTPLGSPP